MSGGLEFQSQLYLLLAVQRRNCPSAAAKMANTRLRINERCLDEMIAARLDKTDWLILKELQASGRMTNVELARRVGISAPPCLRRVRALEQAGVIERYCAMIDERKAGFDVMAFAMVGLHRQSEADLVAFEERARIWPLVRECFMLSGEIDFILKCVAQDLGAFQEFIINELTAAPNVDSVKTSLSIRRSKFEPGIPIVGEQE